MTEGTNTTPEQTQNRVAAAVIKKGKVTLEKNTRALKTLVVEYVLHAALKPNFWNPNRQSDHDFELLSRSMSEDGFTQPIVAVRISEEHLLNADFSKHYALGDLVICDGEHRWRCGGILGYSEVPVVISPYTVTQMMTATLRHNRARGQEDIELAANVLRDLAALGALDHAKESLMLDDADVAKLLEALPATDTHASEEYGEAWRPEEAVSVQSTLGVATRSDAQGATVVVAMTAGALEEQRKHEAALKLVKTGEEKAMLLKDRDVFRISLTFTGEEAKTVREVLKDTPAESLLKLCRSVKDPIQA